MNTVRTDVEKFLDGEKMETTRKFIRLGDVIIPEKQLNVFRQGFGDVCNSVITFISEKQVAWLNEEDANGYFYVLNTKGQQPLLTFYGIVEEHNQRMENPFSASVINFLLKLGVSPIYSQPPTVRLSGETLYLANTIGQIAYFAGLTGNWSFDVRDIEVPCFVRGDTDTRGKVLAIGRSFTLGCLQHLLPRKSAYDPTPDR